MKLPRLERAVIEVEGACNYSCQMCPQPDRPREFLERMPLGRFRDVVAQCVESGVRVINLEGSGEPTRNRNLPRYIEIVKQHGVKAFCFSNGSLFNNGFMRDCIDAGLDFFRFSVVGYDHETYLDWMHAPWFDRVKRNAAAALAYAQGTSCRIASYHLILHPDNEEHELGAYLYNWIRPLGIDAEVWRQHNWAGSYDAPERRGKRRSCGRPFYPDLVVRAGGQVHPCCQVLGRDAEAVLGTVTGSTSLADIWHGEAYTTLREQHRNGDWPSYCQGCDFLIDDPNVLVWTNYERGLNSMHGTQVRIR